MALTPIQTPRNHTNHPEPHILNILANGLLLWGFCFLVLVLGFRTSHRIFTMPLFCRLFNHLEFKLGFWGFGVLGLGGSLDEG
jgi:hypothetical protein